MSVDGIVGPKTWSSLGYTGETTASSTTAVATYKTPTSLEPALLDAGTPIYKQPWFIPAVVGGAILLAGTIFIVVKA